MIVDRVSKPLEVGRIRMGDQTPITSGPHKGKMRPRKLTTFRLTSNNQLVLQQAARIYGGDVLEWDEEKSAHKWQLYTTSNTLRVIIHGRRMMDTWREKWDGGFCTRRCDGATIVHASDEKLIGTACLCPEAHEARRALASQGKACQEVSRVLVMIHDLPFGYWRLDSGAFYGPAEIRGLQEFLELAGLQNVPMPAYLRLEPRMSKRLVKGKPQTFKFMTAIIEPVYSTTQLLQAAQDRPAGFLTTPAALPNENAKSLAEHASDLYGDGYTSPGAVSMSQEPIEAPESSRAPGRATDDSRGIQGGVVDDTLWRQILGANIDAIPAGPLKAECEVALREQDFSPARGNELAGVASDLAAQTEQRELI